MNVALLKALVALLPVTVLLAGSVVSFSRRRSADTVVQLAGAACLLIVVLTHVCEALHLLPWMGWGMEGTTGHYLDFSSAILGLTLFPAGYLFRAPKERSASAG